MAKQLGVHKLHGKVDEQSYYYSKNGGYQSRKINPGMGARVKNDAAYANTRLNNAEFGACGACAGAMIRPVTQRWRFILDSIATGKMVKAMKAAMEQDTNSPWGKRLIPVSEMAGIQDVFNSLSKNEFPSDAKSYMASNLLYDSNTRKIELSQGVSISSSYCDQLISKGAIAVQSVVYAFTLSAPQISSDGISYSRPQSILARISDFEADSELVAGQPSQILSDEVVSDAPAILNETTHFGGLLVILLPYKTIGNINYTLQELCSAVWVQAQPGTVE